MSRSGLERRKLVGQRWPNLANLLACFFNEDYDLLYGSVDGAIDQASSDGSTAYRQDVLREWRDWQTASAVDEVRPWLTAMSVHLLFETEDDARKFMGRLYDSLMDRVRAETSKDWKP